MNSTLRKYIARFLFALVLICSLTSCKEASVNDPSASGSSVIGESSVSESTNAIPVQSEIINITSDNIGDYLALELTHSNGRANDFYIRGKLAGRTWLVDATITAYPIVKGSFNAAKLELDIELPIGWEIDTSDSLNPEEKGGIHSFTTLFNLPVDGNKSEVHLITPTMESELSKIPSGGKITVVSASGEFIPEIP